MRRRSELCRFRFADITELPGNRYGIRLRFSKTDQTGKGKTLPLTQNIFELLMQWREKVKSKPGYLFLDIHFGSVVH
jgi:integrase